MSTDAFCNEAKRASTTEHDVIQVTVRSLKNVKEKVTRKHGLVVRKMVNGLKTGVIWKKQRSRQGAETGAFPFILQHLMLQHREVRQQAASQREVTEVLDHGTRQTRVLCTTFRPPCPDHEVFIITISIGSNILPGFKHIF